MSSRLQVRATAAIATDMPRANRVLARVEARQAAQRMSTAKNLGAVLAKWKPRPLSERRTMHSIEGTTSRDALHR
jgi:hypothetical protein